jgi:hypothetical protein
MLSVVTDEQARAELASDLDELVGEGALRATREEVHGVGLPHLSDLFAALGEHVPVYV